MSQAVVGTAAELARTAYSEGELETLFVQVGLSQFTPRTWYGKAKLISGTIAPAVRRAVAGDVQVAEALDRFVTRVAERLAQRPDAEQDGMPFWRLREALRSDGLDLRRELETVDRDAWPPRDPELLGVRLLPLDDPNAPFADLVTALEEDLLSLGLDVAVNCYRQAVDALVDQRFESANGQVRALFEEVLVQAAARVGFLRVKQGDGGRAIRFLVNGGHLSAVGGSDYIRGLWAMTHTNGAHPGTTTAGEAQFRLHAVTTAVRYLVDLFLL